MAFKFFHVSIREFESAEAELNAFLATHRVLGVDRRWVDQGSDSYWAFCVDYLEGKPAGQPRGTKGRAKDYKEILSAEDFAAFAKLRELRKEIAQREAVPVYTVFTNEQLAQMSKPVAAAKADLEQITGVGDARIEK